MAFIHKFVNAPKLIQVTREDGKRTYQTPEGNCYPSVTTILGEIPSKGLEIWKKKMGAERAAKISKAATSRGSALHGVVECYLRNQELVFDNPFTRNLFNKIKSTLDNINNIRLIESALYSNKLRMAGTPDCIGEYGGKLSVIDFKTSTSLKEEKWIGSYYCQTGAYTVMFDELFGERPEQGVIIIAVEEANVPQVFIKDSKECFYMLREHAEKLIDHRTGGK
jgi:genome maintenance exonuclease 1